MKFLRNNTPFFVNIVLLAICALALAIATYVEKMKGTVVAKEIIYYSPLLFGLFLIIFILFFKNSRKYGYLNHRRASVWIVHIALFIILIGACLTYFTGYEGFLHLREGELSESVNLSNDKKEEQRRLPFSIELLDFNVQRYPGSSSPSDFESHVRIITPTEEYTQIISMNNVLEIKNYRFFQASYDADECGTILMVNYDPWGKPITYLGYYILFIGLILSLFHPHSRIVRLIKRQALCIILFIICIIPTFASNDTPLQVATRYSIPEYQAAQIGALAMQAPNGRIIPVNTFSREIMRKLYRKEGIGSLTADQCLLGIITEPQIWAEVPLIYIDNDAISNKYSLSKGHIAFIEIFDENGEYKLEKEVETIYRKEKQQRNAYDKSIIKLDERINLFNQLANGRLINLFPLEGDPAQRWFAMGDDLSEFSGKDSLFVSKILDWYIDEAINSLATGQWDTPQEIVGMIQTYQKAKGKDIMPNEKKIELELIYNRSDLLKCCQIVFLIIGVLSLILFGINISQNKPISNIVKNLLFISAIVFIIIEIIAIALRGYISGYAPLSNSYETMVYLSLSMAIVGMIFYRRNFLVFAIGVGLAGLMLFVSRLSWLDPQITPLIPVLKSPWLMFHVAIIIAAYGFFGISSLLGITNIVLLCDKSQLRQVKELTTINEISLWIGLVLMTAGTFLGAIWANESWGRYWSWDPKETWALITIFVYSCITHIHLMKLKSHLWFINIFSVLALLSVIMTYWGVNYFLSGMHSYGG